MIVTIDGPAGAGKSSTAKEIAQKVSYSLLDTGAVYRCLTLYLLDIGYKDYDIMPDEIEKEEYKAKQDELINLIKDVTVDEEYKDGVNIIYLNGKDVSKEIRQPRILKHISEVCATKEIRKKVNELAKKISEGKDIVAEGRDMGSILFKDTADIKIFLTASSEERGKRRYSELKGINIDEVDINDPEFIEIVQAIEKRDFIDMTRKNDPLVIAEGAIVIDSTNMTKQEVVDKIVKMIEEKKKV